MSNGKCEIYLHTLPAWTFSLDVGGGFDSGLDVGEFDASILERLERGLEVENKTNVIDYLDWVVVFHMDKSDRDFINVKRLPTGRDPIKRIDERFLLGRLGAVGAVAQPNCRLSLTGQHSLLHIDKWVL